MQPQSVIQQLKYLAETGKDCAKQPDGYNILQTNKEASFSKIYYDKQLVIDMDKTDGQRWSK